MGFSESMAWQGEGKARNADFDSWETMDKARDERWSALENQTDELNKMLSRARAQIANSGGGGAKDIAPSSGESMGKGATRSSVVVERGDVESKIAFEKAVAARLAAEVPSAQWGHNFEVDCGNEPREVMAGFSDRDNDDRKASIERAGPRAPEQHQPPFVPQLALRPHLQDPPFVDDFEDEAFLPPSSSNAPALNPLEQVLTDSYPHRRSHADDPINSLAPHAGGVMLVQQPIRAGRLQGSVVSAPIAADSRWSVGARATGQAGLSGGYSYPGASDSLPPSLNTSRSSMRGSAAAPSLLSSTSNSPATSTTPSPSASPRPSRPLRVTSNRILVSSSSPGFFQTGTAVMRAPMVPMWHFK